MPRNKRVLSVGGGLSHAEPPRRLHADRQWWMRSQRVAELLPDINLNGLQGSATERKMCSTRFGCPNWD